MSRIEHLFRKELRELGFSPTGRKHLVETGTVETRVALALVAALFDGRVILTLVPESTRRRKNVYQASSLETELCRELRNWLDDDDKRPRFPVLMSTIPEELILAYAEQHHLGGEPLAPRDEVRELIEELQRQQPQTKACFRKSFAHLGKGREKTRKRI